MDPKETGTVDPEVDQTVSEGTSAHSEDVTSSTNPEEGSQEGGQSQDQAKGQSEFDHLKVLEGLQLDPKIKEALKSGYLRQADYTKKTQEIASVKKIADEYQRVRPIIEFLDKNPELFNQVFEKMNGGQQPQEGQVQPPEDPVAYAEWVKAQTIKEFQSIQAQEADFQSAAKIDQRLDADPEFGEMVARMVVNDPDFRSKQISATEATKRAVQRFDKYMESQIAKAKTSLSEKAKQKRIGSTVRTTPGSVSEGKAPTSIMEAAQMAEEELANS